LQREICRVSFIFACECEKNRFELLQLRVATLCTTLYIAVLVTATMAQTSSFEQSLEQFFDEAEKHVTNVFEVRMCGRSCALRLELLIALKHADW